MASKIVKNHEKPRMVQILEDMQDQLQKMSSTIEELMLLVRYEAKYDENGTSRTDRVYDGTDGWRNDALDINVLHDK